jgi:hypothetical protein
VLWVLGWGKPNFSMLKVEYMCGPQRLLDIVWQCRVAALDWWPSCVDYAGAVDLGVRAACWLGGGCTLRGTFRLLSPGVVFRVEVVEQQEMRTRHLSVGQAGDSVCICAPYFCTAVAVDGPQLCWGPDWSTVDCAAVLAGPCTSAACTQWNNR